MASISTSPWASYIIRRATTGIEEHGGFPGYHVVLSFPDLLPLVGMLPAAIYAGWSRRKESPVAGVLSLGWIIGPLILLECVRGPSLIHYYLPAFPAWALLIAWMIVAVLTESEVALDFWKLGRLAIRCLGGSLPRRSPDSSPPPGSPPPSFAWPALSSRPSCLPSSSCSTSTTGWGH